MFQKARLKLTAWYLLIISCILAIFSASIYQIQTTELQRFVNNENRRFERQFVQRSLNYPLPPVIDSEMVEDIKNRLLLNLLILDGAILILSGISGYFLAGKTLYPIKVMMDDQDRFISDSSHELRTPLTSLKTAMEVALKDKNLTLKDAKTLISENIEDVNRLQKLSDSLIQLTRKNIKQSLVTEKLNIKTPVESAIDQIKNQAFQKKITIKSLLKSSFVSGDKDKLTNLLVILLDNAVKYSPENKKIVVKTWKTKHFVNISVKDQGIGIDKKDLPHIFDRFYRADTSRTSSQKASGYGLGLSIAKMIVDQHHGAISVKSEPTKGSVFLIRLPS